MRANYQLHVANAIIAVRKTICRSVRFLSGTWKGEKMAKGKESYAHNRITDWLEKGFPVKEGYEIHRNLEDFSKLREDFEQKPKLPIDPRLPVDLICAKEEEEPTEKGKEKFWHYTIFLVNSTETISESLRKRLSFYQFYLSRIPSIQPNRLMIVVAIPHYFDVEAADKEFFKENGFGLWQIDIDKNEKKEVVPAKNLRDRMSEEFKKAVDEPEDPKEPKEPKKVLPLTEISKEIPTNVNVLREAIKKRAEDFVLFFEEYIDDAVWSIAGISPEQFGKRYVDRKLLDFVLKLENVSYRDELFRLVNEHLTEKGADYSFSRECFKSLWKSNFDGMEYPGTLERFEIFLQQFDPEYREHFIHQLQVFLLGAIILDHLFQSPTELFENGETSVKKGNLVKGWLLASSIHDFTYPLQKYDEFSSEFFEQQLKIEESLSFLELKGIYVEKTFLTRVEHLLSKLENDFVDTGGWEKTKLYNEIRRFFYYEIAEKKNHGLMGSSYLLKQFEGKDPEILSNIVLPAAVASSMHDDEIWQTLSGQINGDIEKKWGYITGLMGKGKDITADILRNTNINDEQKETEITDTLRKKHGEWVGNLYADISNIIIKKPLFEVYLKKQPLTFLLILCDNLQDFGRPCKDKERMKVIEEADIRLRNISFDPKTLTLTIKLGFNDIEQTLDFMSQKIKMLRKMESYLKSRDIKFIIEYWDRVADRRKYTFTIN